MNHYREVRSNHLKDGLLNSVRIIIFIIGISSTLYIAYNVSHPGYDYLYLLPLIYSILFTYIISPILFKKKNIFLIVFSIYTFVRYIILPTLIVYSNHYDGRSSIPPLDSSFELAIWLLIYEMIIICTVLYLLFKNCDLNSDIHTRKINGPNNYFIYIVFISITFILVLLQPSTLQSFYFLIPPDGLVNWTEGSLISSIIFYFLVISKFIVFVLLMSFFYKKYLLTNSKIYILLSFLVTFMNIFIIFGSNRANFIITAVASMVLFYKLYPKQSRIASIVLVIFIILSVSLISVHRDHATYTDGNNQIVDVTNTLQIYMGGPYNVAIATEAAKNNEDARNIMNFGYDMLRSTLGPNLLLQGVDLKSSASYFNERIYFEEHNTQIIPMIGQGYFFFGFLFSPIIMISFMIFARILINYQYNQARIELYFFLTITIIRIGISMGQNGSILMNDTSFFLLLFIFIYYFNNRIVVKKRSKNSNLNY
ncbi:O-antigen polymerase [Alkalicoccus luteus]|uniref:Oligosaccharide repeat unit polymerase n=1 Tax=Alkalicoccus luteus TaxID=1237094 RepID=A0A969PR31_9BACI|nr:O-antigen polymerase [Alkalicoccus luteus]NJP37454.1 oligosaccharide repeat unit polymerase [Alkalicoccus luteus]